MPDRRGHRRHRPQEANSGRIRTRRYLNGARDHSIGDRCDGPAGYFDHRGADDHNDRAAGKRTTDHGDRAATNADARVRCLHLRVSVDAQNDEFDGTLPIIGTPRIEQGPAASTFSVDFSPTLGLIGTVDNDTGLVKEITVIGMPSSTLESGDMLLAWGYTVAVVDPVLTPDDRGELIIGRFGDSPGFGSDGFEDGPNDGGGREARLPDAGRGQTD